jgi:hypothetical protein
MVMPGLLLIPRLLLVELAGRSLWLLEKADHSFQAWHSGLLLC